MQLQCNASAFCGLQNVFGDKCLDKRFTSAAPASSWLAQALPAGLMRMLGGKRELDAMCSCTAA